MKQEFGDRSSIGVTDKGPQKGGSGGIQSGGGVKEPNTHKPQI